MTDRERLIELIKVFDEAPEKTCPYPEGEPDCENCKYSINNFICDVWGRKADYLLENGVIVPPCKVGDMVWAIAITGKIYKYMVNGFHYFEDKHFMFGAYRIREDGKKVNPTWQDIEIGKTVFLTLEEAEKALKERETE